MSGPLDRRRVKALASERKAELLARRLPKTVEEWDRVARSARCAGGLADCNAPFLAFMERGQWIAHEHRKGESRLHSVKEPRKFLTLRRISGAIIRAWRMDPLE